MCGGGYSLKQIDNTELTNLHGRVQRIARSKVTKAVFNQVLFRLKR